MGIASQVLSFPHLLLVAFSYYHANITTALFRLVPISQWLNCYSSSYLIHLFVHSLAFCSKEYFLYSPIPLTHIQSHYYIRDQKIHFSEQLERMKTSWCFRFKKEEDQGGRSFSNWKPAVLPLQKKWSKTLFVTFSLEQKQNWQLNISQQKISRSPTSAFTSGKGYWQFKKSIWYTICSKFWNCL